MAVQLLVSVADAADARAALAGGADVIDAKDPTRGALGPVDPSTRAAIIAAVSGARPVSAALGDAAADTLADGGPQLRGLAFAKLGFGPAVDRAAAVAAAAALVRDARAHDCAVVLAAYAETIAPSHRGDEGRWSVLDADTVLDVAVTVGATGVLLDTADKEGPGLFALLGDAVADWVRRAHAAGLSVALAGRLGPDDVERAAAAGAHLVGVRGAACDGSRTGRISVDRVRLLVAAARGARATVAGSQWPELTATNAGAERIRV